MSVTDRGRKPFDPEDPPIEIIVLYREPNRKVTFQWALGIFSNSEGNSGTIGETVTITNKGASSRRLDFFSFYAFSLVGSSIDRFLESSSGTD